MNVELGFISLAVLMALLALRVPIGLALMGVALGGLYLLRGWNPAFSTAKVTPFEFVAHWTLSAIPMFILMGAIASNSGMIGSIYNALRLWLGRLPGGLAIATSCAGAGFAAMSGSSLATTAAMSRIAVPEMLKSGYDPRLAAGVAAAVGTVGALIPPSITIVIYATFAQVSVGRMLIAGLIPGLLTAGAYALLVFVLCKTRPKFAPPPETEGVTLAKKIASLSHIWPIPILAVGILGSIYGGFATATEAAGLGVILTFFVVLLQRRMSLPILRQSISETVTTTASIFLIAIGAALMTQFLAFTGMPAYLSNWISQLTDSPLGIMLICCAIYLLLGCFLDPLGVMLLTLPIILPIIEHAQIDEIWAGIILIKMLEIGLLTPPLGLNVFVVRGTLGDRIPLGTIFAGTTWFLVAEFFIMILLLSWPPVITWLPSLMEF